MKAKPKPGDIVAYRRRPRNKSEILCHNHINHHESMAHGANGFRWFTARRGGGWKKCPCGWRPDLGVHYAGPDHVKYWEDVKAGRRKRAPVLGYE